jgi:hypothetical protein
LARREWEERREEGEDIPGREKSTLEGPEIEKLLVCWRKQKNDDNAGPSQQLCSLS